MKKYLIFGKKINNKTNNTSIREKKILVEDTIAQIIVDTENKLRKERNKYRISHNEMKIVAENAAKEIVARLTGE